MEAKAGASERFEAVERTLIELSHRIHAHPELGFQEERASAWLCETMADAGFTVESGVCGIPTAFAARAGSTSVGAAPRGELTARTPAREWGTPPGTARPAAAVAPARRAEPARRQRGPMTPGKHRPARTARRRGGPGPPRRPARRVGRRVCRRRGAGGARRAFVPTRRRAPGGRRRPSRRAHRRPAEFSSAAGAGRWPGRTPPSARGSAPTTPPRGGRTAPRSNPRRSGTYG